MATDGPECKESVNSAVSFLCLVKAKREGLKHFFPNALWKASKNALTP